MDAENPADDATLLLKINEAVAAANKAETTVATAQAELVLRSKAVGVLLLEARRLHPTVRDFEAFLKKVQGLKLSRAYDLLRLAGGRTTDEEIRKATRDRVKKHRSKKKVPPSKKPEPLSVTSTPVTESLEAERPKAEPVPTWMADARQSSRYLAEFTVACRTWLRHQECRHQGLHEGAGHPSANVQRLLALEC
jgi:hypothetical protein